MFCWNFVILCTLSGALGCSPPSVEITGRILCHDGTPIPDAVVTVTGDSFLRVDHTGRGGRFAVEMRATESYVVRVRSGNFESQHEFTVDGDTDIGDLKLKAVYYEPEVLDVQGQPVRAELVFFDAGTRREVGRGSSDQAGFASVLLPLGKLEMAHISYDYALYFVKNTDTRALPDKVVLDPKATLHFEIDDPNPQRPFPAVELISRRGYLPKRNPPLRDGKGSYGGLEPGDYELRARVNDRDSQWVSVTLSRSKPATVQFVIPPADQIPPIQARFIDHNGETMKGVVVRCRHDGELIPQHTVGVVDRKDLRKVGCNAFIARAPGYCRRTVGCGNGWRNLQSTIPMLRACRARVTVKGDIPEGTTRFEYGAVQQGDEAVTFQEPCHMVDGVLVDVPEGKTRIVARAFAGDLPLGNAGTDWHVCRVGKELDVVIEFKKRSR
ncbi:MAG: carboxypeptidase-like regulatory domain-containing protein [Planctomycetota bacterium]